MSRTEMVARRARRRIVLRDGLAALGPAMLVAACGTLVLVALDRLTGVRIPVWIAAVVPATVAGAFIAGRLVLRRRTLIFAAQEVDQRLGLADRLSTTLALEPSGDAFATLAVRAGEEAAQRVSVREAVPVRLGFAWAAWPVVLGLAIAGGVFLPERSGAAVRERQARAEYAERSREFVSRLEAAAAAARAAADPEIADAAEHLRSLEELRRELERPAEGGAGVQRNADLDQAGLDESVSRAAESLGQLAAAQERAAAEASAADAEIHRQLAELPPPAADESSPLTRAIRRGDLDAARRAAEELLRPERTLGAEERGRLIEDLRKLSEDLRAADTAEADAEKGGVGGEERPSSGQERASPESRPPSRPRPRPEDRSVRDAETPSGTPSAPREKTRSLAERLREAAERLKSEDNTPPPAPSDDSAATDAESDAKPPAERPRPPEAKAEPPSKEEGERAGRGGSGARNEGDPQKGQTSSKEGEAAPSSVPSQPQRSGSNGRPADQQADTPTSEQEKPERSSPGTNKPAAGRERSEQPASASSDQGGTAEGPKPQKPSGERETVKPTERKGEPPRTSRDPRDGSPASREPGAKDAPQGDKDRERPAAGEGVEPGTRQGPKPDDSPAAKPGRSPQDRSEAKERTEQGQRPAQPSAEDQGQPRGTRPRNDPTAGDRSGDQRSETMEPGKEGQVPNTLSERDKQAIRRLSEEIDRLNQPGRDSIDRRRSADELRRRAQELYEASSPEQKSRMQRWVQEAASRQPSAGGGSPRSAGDSPSEQRLAQRPSVPGDRPRFETIDARPRGRVDPGEDSREQVVAEWLGESVKGEGPSPAAQQRLLEARRSAEQAIDDRAVPSRYDRVLRDYFKRLPEKVRTSPGTPSPAPSAAPAEDAP